jgi:hypothetical protein
VDRGGGRVERGDGAAIDHREFTTSGQQRGQPLPQLAAQHECSLVSERGGKFRHALHAQRDHATKRTSSGDRLDHGVCGAAACVGGADFEQLGPAMQPSQHRLGDLVGA